MQIPDKRLSTLLRIPRGSGFIPSRIFSQAYLVVFVASLSNLSSQPNGYIRALTAQRSWRFDIEIEKLIDPEGFSGLKAGAGWIENSDGASSQK